MRFALIGPTYPFRGGIAHYTTSLYRALARGHDVLLVGFKRQYPTLLFPGRTQFDESSEHFEVANEAVLDSINPVTWRAVSRRITDYAPDAVVFQWWHPFFGPAYRQICRGLNRAGIPVLFLCHNIYSHEPLRFGIERRFQGFLTRKAFETVDGFLVHAESEIAKLWEIRPGAEVRKVFHPIYDFYLQWDLPEVPVRASNRPRLLFFGKVRRYKGLETLLHALALVRREQEFEALIAGEFYMDVAPFLLMARKLGLGDELVWRTRYIPNEEVPLLFRSADLVVLPYNEATQSGVVPVAYLFEVPVIATNVGGLSEVVHDGRTGYLVPPNDPGALAEKILRFLKEGRTDEFKRNIRDFARTLSWQQVVDGILSVVQGIRESALQRGGAAAGIREAGGRPTNYQR